MDAGKHALLCAPQRAQMPPWWAQGAERWRCYPVGRNLRRAHPPLSVLRCAMEWSPSLAAQELQRCAVPSAEGLQKNIGTCHPARAARCQGDLDDGLVDRNRGLHTNAGTSAGFWQGRDEDLRFAQLRIARLHRSSNTRRSHVRASIWLHIKSEVERTTQDHSSPACPKGKR